MPQMNAARDQPSDSSWTRAEFEGGWWIGMEPTKKVFKCFRRFGLRFCKDFERFNYVKDFIVNMK